MFYCEIRPLPIIKINIPLKLEHCGKYDNTQYIIMFELKILLHKKSQ